MGLLILMSGISFGLLGVQFTCIDNTPVHILLTRPKVIGPNQAAYFVFSC